jgi:plastocyanin
LLFPLAALLGAAAVVLPAVASSEASPTISAVNSGGVYGEHHEWSPASASVGAGGTVTLKNASNVPHGVRWVSGPATPACAGVPESTTPEHSGTNWSGTCTFTTPGTYTFYCTVHGAEMTGTITVNANGTTTGTTQGGPPGTAPTGTATVQGAGPEASGAGGPSGSPLAGSAASAIRLAPVQHGGIVRGSVALSEAASGGRLVVDLLAKRASLARRAPLTGTPGSALAGAGRLVRSSLRAGLVSFKVTLNARAAHALRAHHRLALSVRIVIRPLRGAPVTVTRAVLLRP